VNSDGIGLVSIKNRVQAFNGFLKIDSELNVGTTVYIEFDIATL